MLAHTMRILHYIPAILLEQGGVVRAILDWCTVLSSRGHQMTLVAYNGKDIPSQWLEHLPGQPHAYVVDFPMPPAKQLNRAAMKLLDRLLGDTDVLHLHAPWLDGNRQLARLAHRRSVPYVVTLHGMLDDWPMTQRGWKKSLYMTLFGRTTLNQAACVHCTADAELSQAGKWFNHRRSAVLPYLIDLEPFRDLPGPDSALTLLPKALQDVPRLLFLSRISEQKGLDLLIQAVALLRDRGVQFVLMIAGNGFPAYESRIRAMVRELNLDQHVIFLGLITGEQKVSLYQSADLFVLPTRHENFGLVLLEAMACGTAVLTTRGTDIWPLVQTAGAQIVDSTPQAIATAATEMLNHRQEWGQRADRARDWVLQNFATDANSRRYESLYENIASCHAGCHGDYSSGLQLGGKSEKGSP